MHNCKYGRVTPKTYAQFWQTKRLANKTRDKKNLRTLKQRGWQILLLWECQTKTPETLQITLQTFLTQ